MYMLAVSRAWDGAMRAENATSGRLRFTTVLLLRSDAFWFAPLPPLASLPDEGKSRVLVRNCLHWWGFNDKVTTTTPPPPPPPPTTTTQRERNRRSAAHGDEEPRDGAGKRSAKSARSARAARADDDDDDDEQK